MAAILVYKWQKIFCFDVQGMVHGFVERYGENVLAFQNPKQLGMAFSVGYLAANEASNDSKCASKILF